MKIVFDLTPIYDHLTGVERYNLNITKNIIENNLNNEYVLIFKNEIHKDFKSIALKSKVKCIVIQSCNKFFFIQVKLLIELLKIEADYYVFLSFTSPLLFRKRGIINAIHDLTCWDCPNTIPLKMKYYYRLSYWVASKVSWKIITVSEFSQGRICEKYKLNKEKVVIVYDGLTDVFENSTIGSSDIRRKYNLPTSYYLCLSTLEPRKNIRLLIRAYDELINQGSTLPDLVLAGRQGWKLEEVFGEISSITENRIHFTGYIEDEDLPHLYRAAEAFVFPSLYEGFGLPIIEAMSQETIVVSSDAASLPEIMGDAGLLFESNNIESLKQSILHLQSLSEEEKISLVTKGKKRSRAYSWKTEAQKLLFLMQKNEKIRN